MKSSESAPVTPVTSTALPETSEQLSNSDLRELELEEARRIQTSLLPTGPLRGSNFEIASRFTPFSDVSGDFADYFDLPNGLVGIYIGDVTGKGISAAMYGAMVMGTLRGTNKTGEEPCAILATLNERLLARPVPGRFCSTIYAVLNPSTLELTFSNSGLPLPLHATPSGCAAVGSGGLPSGLFPGATYDTHSIQMLPGDAVLFATDGMHEAQNAKGEDFGWKELPEICQECRTSSAEETLEALFTRLKRFSSNATRSDDVTAVIVKAQPTMVVPRPGGGFRRVAAPLAASR